MLILYQDKPSLYYSERHDCISARPCAINGAIELEAVREKYDGKISHEKGYEWPGCTDGLQNVVVKRGRLRSGGGGRVRETRGLAGVDKLGPSSSFSQQPGLKMNRWSWDPGFIIDQPVPGLAGNRVGSVWKEGKE
ncbi:hypothetical protein ElyMa_004582400 [Elysia marginata]|uniref:Uncharacterized protein n=1 Tax=Elysia marginata TaxID=1093978 RepID=A0AAV4HWB1_9GAST|nr:hypothetical protein ElyMa_004582400 [Elysia marginata]